jgi:aromatic ring-opening dioxygenase LigB subunit
VTITVGAIVPHAPLFAIDLSDRHPLRVPLDRVSATLDQLSFASCDAVVLVSPHGTATGIYRAVRGSLSGFGRDGTEVEAIVDAPLAGEISTAWGHPLLEGPADHGIVGPLSTMDVGSVPVVAVSFAGISGPSPVAEVGQVLDASRALARAIESAAGRGTVAVVASAHTSAALSPRAPLTDRREGHELDARIRAALDGEPAALARIEPSLWAAAGACGAAPLAMFGLLFEDARIETLAYEAPAGVGYLVARAHRS